MITPVKKKAFSGLSHLFDGFLEKKLNEIITTVNGGTAAQAPAIAALTPVTVADATDAASAAALANANKAAINAIVAALQA